MSIFTPPLSTLVKLEHLLLIERQRNHDPLVHDPTLQREYRRSVGNWLQPLAG
jgi:hypothetical protein